MKKPPLRQFFKTAVGQVFVFVILAAAGSCCLTVVGLERLADLVTVDFGDREVVSAGGSDTDFHRPIGGRTEGGDADWLSKLRSSGLLAAVPTPIEPHDLNKIRTYQNRGFVR
jgi:hypothetical protein